MTIVQNILQKSYTYRHIPNHLFPFVCVYILVRTPSVLLVGVVVVYIMGQPSNSSILQVLDHNNENKKLTTAPPRQEEIEEQIDVNNEEEDCDRLENNSKLSTHSTIFKPEENEHALSKRAPPSLLSNSSIDFENLMKFPACPTTLPRLDTHFNFVSDHDIKNPDPSSIDWSAIHQEIEYDQQRLNVDSHHSNIGDSLMNITADRQRHPLLLLHQLQQDNLSIMFSDEEEDISPISSTFSVDGNKMDIENYAADIAAEATPIQQKRERKDVEYAGETTPTPFHFATTDAAILFVDNEEFTERVMKKGLVGDETLFSVNIEDLLLLPPAPMPSRPSLSSPGQLFKNKFQKAVRKMKKSSSNSSKYDDTMMVDKRSSIHSDESSKKAASLQLHSCYPQQQEEDPVFSAGALSPRPSASARVQGHFKGRLNKLFRK